jgi:uncharacterized membrane protein YgaE (UPF0421/DUF939 family)
MTAQDLKDLKWLADRFTITLIALILGLLFAVVHSYQFPTSQISHWFVLAIATPCGFIIDLCEPWKL